MAKHIQKAFPRIWFCAAPAIAFGLPQGLFVHPGVGAGVFVVLFVFGWIMTAPRPERGETGAPNRKFFKTLRQTRKGQDLESSAAPLSSSVNHLVILHRVLYGTIDKQQAIDYLHLHLREDADLADMGRPLRLQYKDANDA